MAKPKALPPGVRIKGNAVYVRFTWNKKQWEERVDGDALPATIARAAKIYSELKQKIRFGAFDLAEYRRYFPQSPHAAVVGEDTDFVTLAQRWLDNIEVSEATRAEYVKALNLHWLPHLGGVPIAAIKPSDVRIALNAGQWKTNKTRNNALIPLRGVFQMAVEDELIAVSPAAKIKNLKHQKNPPDPFTREEADTIIAHLYRSEEKIHACYFEFAFYCGMRTSEMLALTWSDVDFRQGYVRVSKARSKGRDNEQTKTATVRDVLLNPRSRHALTEAKALTFLAGGAVFRSARYTNSEHFRTEKAQRLVFQKALKKLGIRHRPAYNTRHTYATMLLMAGSNPAFVAAQLGHSITMTLTTYAKWIHGEASQKELEKLSFAPSNPSLSEAN